MSKAEWEAYVALRDPEEIQAEFARVMGMNETERAAYMKELRGGDEVGGDDFDDDMDDDLDDDVVLEAHVVTIDNGREEIRDEIRRLFWANKAKQEAETPAEKPVQKAGRKL